MSDPMGFYNEGFDGIEPTEGNLSDVLPEQWAVWDIEETEFRFSKEKHTPGVNMRVRAHEQYSMTPKRGFYTDVYLTEKTQSQLDRFTRATGLGYYSVRFGGKSGDNDPRVEASSEADVEKHGTILAGALKGRSFISRCLLEKGDKDKGYSDKTRFNGFEFFKANPENIGVLVQAGFDPKRIKIGERPGPKGKERFLQLKTEVNTSQPGPGPRPSHSVGVIE